MSDFEVVTEGLSFPEGPVWMEDGSIVLVETTGGCITRVRSNGQKETVATPGGGPNGAAIGPDGALYVCNNGGMLSQVVDGLRYTSGEAVPDYETGRIERIDLNTGKVERLYDTVDGRRLAGPNDLVFDRHGGIWFSDLGKHRGHVTEDGGIFYAKADGSSITRVVDHMQGNGIGLSPDGKTLYVALSHDRLLVAFDIVAPGQLAKTGMIPGRVVSSFPGRQLLDSLSLTADGHVCVATVFESPGIAQVDPSNPNVTANWFQRTFPDLIPTNICFGGPDFRDAWITLSSSGRLIKVRWDRPGLRLAHYA
jgi:gluconolactonase